MDRRRLGQERLIEWMTCLLQVLLSSLALSLLLKSQSKQAAFVHLMNVKHLQKGIEFRPGRR